MKTIIEMAREAGFEVDEDIANVWVSDAYIGDKLEAFAALVRADEREACAAMAEAFHRHQYDFTGDLELHEAIRARGKT